MSGTSCGAFAGVCSVPGGSYQDSPNSGHTADVFTNSTAHRLEALLNMLQTQAGRMTVYILFGSLSLSDVRRIILTQSRIFFFFFFFGVRFGGGWGLFLKDIFN